VRHAPHVSLGAGASPEIYRFCSSSDLKLISLSVSSPALITNRSQSSRPPASCACRHYELISVQPRFSLLCHCPHYWLNFRARQPACGGWGDDWERGHSFWNYYSHHVLLTAPSAGSVVQGVCKDSKKNPNNIWVPFDPVESLKTLIYLNCLKMSSSVFILYRSIV